MTRKKTIAWSFGLVCHAAFAVAIASMVVALYTGMMSGLGRLHGWQAILANTALLLQFPIGHSLLLTQGGRRILARLAPMGLGRDLATTTYAIIASFQLMGVFVFWSPSGAVLWQAQGVLRGVFTAAFAASWLLVAKTIYDAGLALQTGALGWRAVVRGERPLYPPFSQRGAFKYCRQPVYLAFTLTLWTGPVLTPERLVLAIAWTAYCLFGPFFKEARYLEFTGASYREYQSRVPYWLPGRSRSPCHAEGKPTL